MPSRQFARLMPSLSLFSFLLLSLGLHACGHPCRDLSDTICNCMPTTAQQQDCRRRVQAIEAQRPTQPGDAAGDKVCETLLDQCSCEALSRGDLTACGLATE